MHGKTYKRFCNTFRILLRSTKVLRDNGEGHPTPFPYPPPGSEGLRLLLWNTWHTVRISYGQPLWAGSYVEREENTLSGKQN